MSDLRVIGGIATIFALLILICTATPVRTEFGAGVRSHEKCIANPDNWWCSLWGADD